MSHFVMVVVHLLGWSWRSLFGWWGLVLDPARGIANGSFLYMGYGTNDYIIQVLSLLHTNYDVVITSHHIINVAILICLLWILMNKWLLLYFDTCFSAGNDGSSNCGYGAGSGWGNVTGGHKQAKNVIAVANLDYEEILLLHQVGIYWGWSYKADVGAKGSSVYSTEHNNTYGTKTGTSMSCPGMRVLWHNYIKHIKINSITVSPPSALAEMY